MKRGEVIFMSIAVFVSSALLVGAYCLFQSDWSPFRYCKCEPQEEGSRDR